MLTILLKQGRTETMKLKTFGLRASEMNRISFFLSLNKFQMMFVLIKHIFQLKKQSNLKLLEGQQLQVVKDHLVDKLLLISTQVNFCKSKRNNSR